MPNSILNGGAHIGACGPHDDGAARRPPGAATAHGGGTPQDFHDQSPCRAPQQCPVLPQAVGGPTVEQVGPNATEPPAVGAEHPPQHFLDHNPCWACSALAQAARAMHRHMSTCSPLIP